MIHAYNGHTFAGTGEELLLAEKATCAGCGKIIKDRHGPITNMICEHPSAASSDHFARPMRTPPMPPVEKIQATAAALDRVLDRAERTGRDEERARVIRIRDACFTGLVLTDDVREALTRFDGMLLRGEDVAS